MAGNWLGENTIQDSGNCNGKKNYVQETIMVRVTTVRKL